MEQAFPLLFSLWSCVTGCPSILYDKKYRRIIPTFLSFSNQGSVSRKSRELFGPEKQVVKLQSACFEKLIF